MKFGPGEGMWASDSRFGMKAVFTYCPERTTLFEYHVFIPVGLPCDNSDIGDWDVGVESRHHIALSEVPGTPTDPTVLASRDPTNSTRIPA